MRKEAVIAMIRSIIIDHAFLALPILMVLILCSIIIYSAWSHLHLLYHHLCQLSLPIHDAHCVGK